MEILIIFVLILLNGIFSMSEIALVSSKKFRLESAARKGNKNAKKALALAEQPNTFLSTVQIGITLIGILTGVFSGARLTDQMAKSLATIDFLAAYAHSLSVGIIVLIITYISIVFGELIPKRLGLTFPEKIASFVAVPMNFLSIAAKPFIWILGRTNDLFLALFGIHEKQDQAASEEEIKAMIAESTNGGEILKIEENIVKRVFTLGDRNAGELMTHRSELTCIEVSEKPEEIRSKIEEFPHAVYPVIDRSFDRIHGTVSARELYSRIYSNEEFDLKPIIQKAIYIQENMPAYKVLEKFKEFQTHLMIIVDEYGSSQGVLSISDLIDALIGDVALRTDQDLNIIKRDDDSWLAEGQCPYFEFITYFNIQDAEEPEGFSTLAGLILKELTYFPSTGDKIEWNHFSFEIIDMDDKRIDKILITKIQKDGF